MKSKRIKYLVDWIAIIAVLIISFCTTTNDFLWGRFTYIAPVPIFIILCILFFNHVSLIDCFKSKDKEFFLLSGGVFLSAINLFLVKSHVGSIFTITNFLLVLYLADKICFDRLQLAVIAMASFFIIFYWLFINKGVYGNVDTNSNRASIFIFMHFCVFVCCITYILFSFQMIKWPYYIVILLLLIVVSNRILSLRCRGVFLATLAWAGTCYILPKKKWTILFVIGASLLTPVIYVLLWRSGIIEGIVVYGKSLLSGRDVIWYEFFKAFIRQPITGIGSDFDRVLPDLYMKDAHHALLDLLFVHGLPVFMVVLYFLYRRIYKVITETSGAVRDVCLACIYGVIAMGSLENGYIISPCNVLFLTFFVVSHTFSQKQTELYKISESL